MISIVIPTYNEKEHIEKIITYLAEYGKTSVSEIIVSDGGSTDGTIQLAANAGARAVLCPAKGRAAQMNHGASLATGEILYFVHADTFPPNSFVPDIEKYVQRGFDMGRYRTRFNSSKLILRVNAFFTRFNLFMCYGGDQTLFIKRQLFAAIGGFNSSMRIMEDYDIVQRARQRGRYKIIPKSALVSARKYDNNSWLTVQSANYTIIKMYRNGASQEAMAEKYRQLLDYR